MDLNQIIDSTVTTTCTHDSTYCTKHVGIDTKRPIDVCIQERIAHNAKLDKEIIDLRALQEENLDAKIAAIEASKKPV